MFLAVAYYPVANAQAVSSSHNLYNIITPEIDTFILDLPVEEETEANIHEGGKRRKKVYKKNGSAKKVRAHQLYKDLAYMAAH